MPKLSIITINYNNLQGLQRTVESVVNQTWKEFEYIVIDGGSTDGSVTYIESQKEHFDYWVSEPDSGIYNAMNKGIEKASGEYLLFLNSGDDFLNSTSLQNNLKEIKGEDIIYFDINVIGNGVFFVKSCPDILKFSYLFHETLPHQSTFIRKKILTELGCYDESIKIVSDWKFFILAIMKYSVTYKHVGKVLSNFYLDGISAIEDYSEERKLVLNECFECFVTDYNEFFESRKQLMKYQDYLNTNRLKMLLEIEKSLIGKKMVSLFFRIVVFFFSKKSLKEILDKQ